MSMPSIPRVRQRGDCRGVVFVRDPSQVRGAGRGFGLGCLHADLTRIINARSVHFRDAMCPMRHVLGRPSMSLALARDPVQV